MTRRLPEELEDKELIPGLRLSDAKKIETVFDNAGIDYTFEITPITAKSVLSIWEYQKGCNVSGAFRKI